MRYFIAIIMSIVANVAIAQSPIHIKLWENKTPLHQSTLTIEEVTDSLGFVSNVSEAEIFIYPANPKKNTGKAIIICPGGGYYGLSMSSEGKDFAKWIADMGITAAVLKYRMPNGNHNLPLEDAVEAFEIMKQKAHQWGVDKNKIGVMGFSAGGHLASTIAVRLEPAFTVLFYPVITSKEGVGHISCFNSLTGGKDKDLIKYYSNELNVTQYTQETLLFHCADDEAVDYRNSQLYADALTQKGVFSELVIFSEGGHGWGFLPRFKDTQKMRAILKNFLINIAQ